MPDQQYYAHVQSLHDGKALFNCVHRGPLADLLKGELRRFAEKSDARGDPRYHVDIGSLDTEQRALVGCLYGPLAPMLGGDTLERARVLDAGKRLTPKQRKEARHGTRH